MVRIGIGILCIAVSAVCFHMMNQCRKSQKITSAVTGKVYLFGALFNLLNALPFFLNNSLLSSLAISCILVCANGFLYFMQDYMFRLIELSKAKKVYKWIISGIIVVDSVIIFSNPWTELVMTFQQKIFWAEPFTLVVPKLLFFIHCIYSYLTLITIIVLLLRKCIRIPLAYDGGYSMTNKLKEPILVFDNKNLLADYNVEAAEKFGLTEKDLYKITREHFETDILQLTYEEVPALDINRETMLQKDYAAITYQLTLKSLTSELGNIVGIMYVFRDITKQKMMYNALENMSAYDQLTGFYTGRIFAEKLAEWDKEPEEYIVAVCNIAGMKLFNSFYDRKVGDGIIQKMSEEVRNVLPEDALVCYSADDSTVIVARGITEEQMNLYLSNAARKLKKRGLENVPVFLNYGLARRENTAVSIEEYIKYAMMDLLIKKGKDSKAQKREITRALCDEYFRNEYESLEHIERVISLAEGMADKLKLNERDKEKLLLLCRYHDIGRVRTREDVWSHAAVITRDERDIIKLHAITGYQILSQMELEHNIAELVLCHHENFDGSGYPYGLAGREIPLISRIFAVIDSYDIMVNDQLYKDAVSEEKALEELKKFSGSQFDPELVTVFETYLKERK